MHRLGQGKQRPVSAVEPVSDRSLLSLETEAAVAPIARTDVVISDGTAFNYGVWLSRQ